MPFELKINFREEAENFLAQIGNSNIDKIADFLEELVKQNAKVPIKINKDELKRLQERINFVAQNSQKDFTTSNLPRILNSLANFGWKKENLKLLESTTLGKVANELIGEMNHFELANVVNGFARLNYDRSEVNLDLPKTLGRVNQNIGRLTKLDILNLFHGLAHLGERTTLEAKKITQKLFCQIGGESFDSRDCAGLIHSLAKLEMFEELAQLRHSSNNLVQKQDLSKMPFESLHALLQAQDICTWIGQISFFDEHSLALIKKKFAKFPPEQPAISYLEKLVAASLPNAKQEQLLTPEHNNTRVVDICYEIANKVFLIEVDGPSHFYSGNQTNAATLQRDKINRAIAADLAYRNPNKDYYCLTLPFYELENCRNEGDYIDQKLNQATKVKPQQSTALTLEDLEFESEASSSSADITKQEVETLLTPAKVHKIKATVKKQEVKTVTLPQDVEKVKGIFAIFSKSPNLPQFLAELKNRPDFNLRFLPHLPQIFVKAIEEGNGNIVSALINEESVSSENIPQILQKMIHDSNGKAVATLIGAGLVSYEDEINIELPQEGAALNFALKQEPVNLEIVSSLINAGAKINFAEIEILKLNQLTKRAVKENVELACTLLKFTEISAPNMNALIKSGSFELVNTVLDRSDTKINAAAILDLATRGKSAWYGAQILDIVASKDVDLHKLDFSGERAKKILMNCLYAGSAPSRLKLVQIPQVANLKVESDGATALHAVAGAGDLEALNALLANGADPCAKESEGHNALDYATGSNNPAVVTRLLQTGRFSPSEVSEAMKVAVKSDNVAVFDLLLKPEDFNEENKKLQLLELVVSQESAQVLQYFFNKTTPSSEAFRKVFFEIAIVKSPEIIEVLASEGIKRNYLDINEEIPQIKMNLLCFAVLNGSENLVKLLSKFNADPDIYGPYGAPLHYAIFEKKHTITRSLLDDYRANPNLISKDKDTPLTVAIRVQDPYAVKLLLQHGADPHLCDINPNPTGQKLLPALNSVVGLIHQERSQPDAAEGIKQYNKIIQTLLDYGADPNRRVADIGASAETMVSKSAELLDGYKFPAETVKIFEDFRQKQMGEIPSGQTVRSPRAVNILQVAESRSL